MTVFIQQSPGSGTFNSLREKMPYLGDLGITGIWLTGHSLAHPTHFYNVWTQYACIEPDVIDPSLGTEADFKAMIAEAHAHGIRVFLDVIEHGVMEDSPLVQRKPHWFRGKSWGMVDYDFDLRDHELDQWWVDTWTRYVIEFGVDGFRIDLGMRRTDLYAQVRASAERVGKEIIFINELNYRGGLDFALLSGLKDNAPRDEFLRLIDFVQRDPPTLLSPHRMRDDEINGQHGYANTWGVLEWEAWLNSVLNRRTNSEVPPFAYSSGQISCHDNGWEGFEGDNPYVAQGSRMIFGYGALFSGLVPIWFSGEEFNAPFKPLPTLSPNLFGGANPGQGKWLYGGVIQWDALDQSENRAMLNDVRRLIAIRKAEADVLGAAPNYGVLTMRPLDYRASAPTPRPYLRHLEGKAVIVAPNMQTAESIEVRVSIPVDEIGLGVAARYRLTDLWNGQTWMVDHAALNDLTMTIAPDKTPGGGVKLIKIEWG